MFTGREKELLIEALEEKRKALRDSFNENYFGTSAAEKRQIEIDCRTIGEALEKVEAMN